MLSLAEGPTCVAYNVINPILILIQDCFQSQGTDVSM